MIMGVSYDDGYPLIMGQYSNKTPPKGVIETSE